MSGKRSHIDLDPDYEDVTDHQAKRQRVQETNAKVATVKKIETIIKNQFEAEIRHKETEVSVVDQRLNQARLIMDRLRACIVANHYSSSTPGLKDKVQPTSIHPTVKKHLGKAPVYGLSAPCERDKVDQHVPGPAGGSQTGTRSEDTQDGSDVMSSVQNVPIPVTVKTVKKVKSPERVVDTRGARFKTKKQIIVGNVSKFIPLDHREVNDQSTHKWMVYVRGPKDKPRIDSFVKKVWFFLHPSYKPNDLVEITQPPFHLSRRGWGEFPVRIQLHFRDFRNKRVDIIHQLKVVEIELEKEVSPTDSFGLGGNSAEKNDGSTCLSGIEGHATAHREVPGKENSLHNGSNNSGTTDEPENSVSSLIKDDESVNGQADAKKSVTKENNSVLKKDVTVVHASPTKNAAPKIIHLSNRNLTPSEMSKSVLDNKQSPPLNSSKNQSVMFMRCKDQHGNLLLLPYRLNQPVARDQVNVVQEDSDRPSVSAQLPSTSGVDTVQSQVNGKQTLPVKACPMSAGCAGGTETPPTVSPAKPAVGNLVLKVTPTGLKLVPADSNNSSGPPQKTVNMHDGTPDGQQNLKSLLYTSPAPTSPKAKSLLMNVDKSPSSSGFKPVVQHFQTTSTQLTSRTKADVNSLNHIVKNPPVNRTSESNPSVLLANIGEKQFVLRVVPGADNQVLLVPNQLGNTSQKSITAASPVTQRTVWGPVLSNLRPPIQKVVQSNVSVPLGVCHKTLSLNTEGRTLSNSAIDAFSDQVIDPEKKIHAWKKKIKDILSVTEEIQPLNLNDYQDLKSVMKAAVRRHPVVREFVDRSQHPYCAQSVEEWLSWNIGKRRASEWQRAAAVRNFVLCQLKPESHFKGEQLWTTKQIMCWCRLHAFSPHHLEMSSHEEDKSLTASKSCLSEKCSPTSESRSLKSMSDLQLIKDRLDALLSTVAASESSDEEVEIVAIDTPTVRLKKEKVDIEEEYRDCDLLPPTDEAMFVQDCAQQVGVRFSSVEVENGVRGSVPEDMLYSVMLRLAEDVLRESHAVGRSACHRPLQELTPDHVFQAVSSIGITDFLTNRHLGIHDDTAPPTGVR